MIKAVIFDLDNTLISEKDRSRFPYALEILTHLKKRYKLALLSNTEYRSSENVYEELREANSDGFFEVVVTACDVGIRKPNPRMFEIVLEKLGVTPDEAVMVGDIISTDIFGGNRIGMRTVLFQPSENYQRSSWEHPDHTINSLKEILALL